MHIYSKKTGGPAGTERSRFGLFIVLLLLLGSSTLAQAESALTSRESPSEASSSPVENAQQSNVLTAVTANSKVPASSTTAAPIVLKDFSPIELYNHADRIVKSVILILIFASLLSWSIWSAKTLELLLRGRRMKLNLTQLMQKRSLRQCDELTAQSCEHMRLVAMAELNHVNGPLSTFGVQALKERVLAQIQQIEAAEVRRATRGASILATTSAVAPFIGLFGTVWGIMHSFISIAQLQTTNLSVVAPGIAEALFATALGLVVAIPAVILYNITGRLITGYRLILAEAMTYTLCLLSHDLDTLEQKHTHLLTSAA